MDTSPLGDPVGLLSGINMVTLDADKDMNVLLCDCLSDKGIKFKKGTIATGDQFVAQKSRKTASQACLMPLQQRWRVAASDMYAISTIFLLQSFVLSQTARAEPLIIRHLLRRRQTSLLRW